MSWGSYWDTPLHAGANPFVHFDDETANLGGASFTREAQGVNPFLRSRAPAPNELVLPEAPTLFDTTTAPALTHNFERQQSQHRQRDSRQVSVNGVKVALPIPHAAIVVPQNYSDDEYAFIVALSAAVNAGVLYE